MASMSRAILLLGLTGLLSLPAGAQTAGLPDFTQLVARNHEAVVNISTRAAADDDDEMMPPSSGGSGPDGTPLDDLIRRFREDREREPGPFGGNALGSGFIISSDGYVLTNNHVVADAEEVVVRLHDRRQLDAVVIGTDPRSDVALLKVDADSLPTVSIGDSDALQVGEWVLAIGSPFGFDFSVTAGIVSATGRALPNENYVPFIQTDVAINPGNSGGPLFNLDGDVIGVNSQIYSRTGSFMGLSFAIPIEMAMDVADQLRDNGRVARGWLGVIIQEVTMELAQSFDMQSAHGALISRILPNSPAADSALQIGDVITHFEGERLDRSSSLPPLVGRVPANASAEIRVIRDGEPFEFEVEIGELPSEAVLRAGGGPRPAPLADNPLQMRVEPLDEQTRETLGVDRGGVLVAAVRADGPAARAGIVTGDVVLSVDNRPVDSPDDYAEVVGSLDGNGPVAVLVQRERGPVFLALRIEP